MSVRVQLLPQAPSTLFLGHTIQEKTRSILGWTNDYRPPVALPAELALPRRQIRRKPYSLNHGPNGAIIERRARKHSTSSSSSTCSESSSTASSSAQGSPSFPSMNDSTIAFSPDDSCGGDRTTPNSLSGYHPACRSLRDVQVFERLRQLVPVLPSDRNAYQVLIETVSQVIDLEQQLEQLNERTEDVRNGLRQEHCWDCTMPSAHSPSTDEVTFPEFPDDLQSVDVSAFKHLIGTEASHFIGDSVCCLSS